MSSLQNLNIRTSSVNTPSLLIVIVILSLIISGPQALHSVQGQPRQMSLNPQSIPIQKVHVGDIDIAYKAFGNGKPVILIGGVPSVMDFWPSSSLQELATNHTVIIFDNCGVGNTSAGTKPF